MIKKIFLAVDKRYTNQYAIGKNLFKTYHNNKEL
jgi:hypothetical protein